jgi:hypothetical protein
MRNKNQSQGIRAAVFSAMAVTILTGCLTGGGSGNGKKQDDDYLFKFDAEVLGVIPPQGAEPGRIITRSTEYSCYDEDDAWITGTAQPITYTDTASYAITDGKLYVWDGQDCMASVYSGTSSTISGSWTSTGKRDSVPTAYQNASCAAWFAICEEYGDCSDDFIEDMFDNYSIVTTISSTSLESRFKGDFCHAREWGEEMPEYLDGIELVSSSCTLVELRNVSSGKIAKVTGTLKDGEVNLNIAYNGETCVRKDSFGPLSETFQCDMDFYDPPDSFYNCLEEAGFYEGVEFGGYDYYEDYSLAKKSGKGSPSTLEILRGNVYPFSPRR